jgi:hypothetical protein
MKTFVNENEIDRLVRIVVGITMLTLGWIGMVENLWGVALRLFGWYPLVTGILGWSPLYAVFDFSTRRNRAVRSSSR